MAGPSSPSPEHARADRRVDRLIRNCQPKVPTDEPILHAWTAVSGPGQWILTSWLTQPLLLLRRHRIFAVTESHVYLFTASWFSNFKPRRLLRVLGREELRTAVESPAYLRLGGRRFAVSSMYHRQVTESLTDAWSRWPPASR